MWRTPLLRFLFFILFFGGSGAGKRSPTAPRVIITAFAVHMHALHRPSPSLVYGLQSRTTDIELLFVVQMTSVTCSSPGSSPLLSPQRKEQGQKQKQTGFFLSSELIRQKKERESPEWARVLN